MRNPYIAALVRTAEAGRAHQPASATALKPSLPERISAFFEALAINHGGNRARVCTGIAHTMSGAELADTIRRLEADQAESTAKLRSLDAPPVIIANEAKKHAPAIRILRRVQEGRVAR